MTGYEAIAIYRDDGYSAKDLNATGLGRWMRVLVRKVKVSDKLNTHIRLSVPVEDVTLEDSPL